MGLVFSELPTPEILQWLAAGRLTLRFYRAVRLWVLLNGFYGKESDWPEKLPQSFAYRDLRECLFSESHPTSDRLTAKQMAASCSDCHCLCHASVLDLIKTSLSPDVIPEWQENLRTLTGWSSAELENQLLGSPFQTVHRTIRDDLKRLSKLKWLQLQQSGFYRWGATNSPTLPPTRPNTAALAGLGKMQTWELLRVLESVAFVQPNLEVVVQSLWEELAEPGVTSSHFEREPQRRIFIHFDYILSDETQDRVDTYQEQIELLWRDGTGGVIQFETWRPKTEEKVAVTVYPVCLHYARRAKYLSAFGIDPDGDLGWHNYRLDRIASECLTVLPWGDHAIPPGLQELWLNGELPTPEEVEMELENAWGFNFYLEAQLLIMRFDPRFARWYVDGTERHPTFQPISYKKLPALIRRHVSHRQEQEALLEILRQRSAEDSYYQGWIRVGDINVLMRLREWRGQGEVIAPFSVRQELKAEALRELSNY